MVIATTKVQSDVNSSVAVEPSFSVPRGNVDSLGDEKLANLAPKKKRRRGRPKQESVVRRMDIVMKRPDMIRKPRLKRNTTLATDNIETSTRPEENYLNQATSSIISKPVAEVPIVTSDESAPSIRPGLLIDSPVRPQNEISTHATAAARSYLPSSPLEGFNEVSSDIETDSKAPISRLLF